MAGISFFIRPNKITHKLILAVGGVAVVGIGAFYYMFILTYYEDLIQQISHQAHYLSNTVKNSIKYDMLINQRESVHMIINTIGEQEGIERVRIFNKTGVIIYSSEKREINEMVNKQAEACYACHAANRPLEKLSIKERIRIFERQDKTRNLGIINPIYNEPACWLGSCHAHRKEDKVLGVLDVTLSLAEVDRQMNLSVIKNLILTVVVILVNGLILWFLVHRFVGRPVKELIRATQAVATGDLTYKIEMSNNDELGDLARSFNDMTERVYRAQQHLYRSDKLASMGRLAAGVAHEINNPLTGVLTYSSFQLKRVQDEELKKDLEVIVRETKRCRDIVKGLLDFARPVSSKKTVADINETINQALTIVENQLSINNIRVIKNLTKSMPPIRIDKNQMEQVFINLLVNAADAIGSDGGEIRLKTDSVIVDEKSWCEIQIEDTGCGITGEQLSNIFEPFFTTKGARGTGLGLAVVWGIIDEHGGRIHVSSEPGVGTEFVIHLPFNSTDSALENNEPGGDG